MRKDMDYETPVVKVLEVKVEQGFAGSGEGEGTLPGEDSWG